jgi:hypothetical protein
VNENHPITLSAYYRAFVSGWGGLATLFSAIPLLSKLLPGNIAAAGFPPLGDAEGPARLLAVVFALAATYCAYFCRARHPRDNRKWVYRAMILALLPLVVYVGLIIRFVRTVEIPSMGTAIQVSVGWERTDFATTNFDGESDWDLLRARGPDEEDIWRLWTPKSLIVSRLGLYVAYLSVLLLLISAFSWGVLSDLTETQA